jgi:hybrid cluster-associated redox disulfide protein
VIFVTEDNKITKDMTFGEVLKKYPETIKTFFEYGMHCFGCHIAVSETIEQGALAHGVDVGQLMQDLNKTVSSTAEADSDKSADTK